MGIPTGFTHHLRGGIIKTSSKVDIVVACPVFVRQVDCGIWGRVLGATESRIIRACQDSMPPVQSQTIVEISLDDKSARQ